MDLEVQIKAEPVWLEDGANASLGNFEFVSETKPLKEETNSELPEPGPSQENTFEPYADIKEELSKEQHTTDELTPNIAQEDNGSSFAVLTLDTGREAHKSTVWNKGTGKRPYRCKKCDSSFALKSTLKGHMVTHTGTGLFCCKECGKSFTRRTSLRTHMYSHSGERPYHCKVCSSSFKRKDYLRTHMVIHSGEKPYFCKECNKSFGDKSNLRAHMVVHSEEGPYHCKECMISYTRKSNLRKHNLTHS